LTASEAVLMTPRVALVNDRMRLACRSPSNRPPRKQWTSLKQRWQFAGRSLQNYRSVGDTGEAD
jgi:hypothetical protein